MSMLASKFFSLGKPYQTVQPLQGFELLTQEIYNGFVNQTIIFLRGKVGSGKSTVAKELRERLPKKAALFDRDYFMHKVIAWEDNNNIVNRALGELTHLYLEEGYNVILEGTFTKKEDDYLISFLKEIEKEKGVNTVFFYLDSTLKTSLKRNKLRSKDKKIEEKWIKEWFKSSIPKNIKGEIVIETDKLSIHKVVESILEHLT